MLTLLVVLVLVLSVTASATIWYVLRVRALRHQRGVFGPWPIRKARLEDLDPVFIPGDYGPTLDTEVTFIGRGPFYVEGGTSDAEAWILAVLAKRSRTMFEFGTCTGKSAYLWARNSPPGATVVTLTLSPTQLSAYSADPKDRQPDIEAARKESCFTRFLYTGTSVDPKVVQLFGDSKSFDETPFLDWADLIFVDGSHAYSYVLSDSQKALRIAKAGGIILWHDYKGPHRADGVFRALNELSEKLPLVHISGTTFVVYRKPLT